MNVLQLNTPAISQDLSIKEVDVKIYANGARHMGKDKIITKASPERPVYRVSKDYKSNALKFSLNIITYDEDIAKVEKWLDAVAKSLSADEIKSGIESSPFKFLDKKYGEK